jgi:uncharacterized protein (TIGR02145 family)
MKKNRILPFCIVLIMFFVFFNGCKKDENIVNIYPPELITTTVSNITPGSAQSGGNISYDGGDTIIGRGIVWGTTQKPTLEDNNGYTSDGSGTGGFVSNIINLVENTTYYVRAYAINNADTSYGDEQIFIAGNYFIDSRDGNYYRYVTIGNQVWMANNLAYLPEVNHLDNGSTVVPCYYVGYFENTDLLLAKSTDHYLTYGVSYNWEAAKKACPDGWHLPSNAEWAELVNFVTDDGHAGKEAVALKAKSSWSSSGNGTDMYGFSALAGGSRNPSGSLYNYAGRGSSCVWWTSTERNTNNAYGWCMDNSYEIVRNFDYDKSIGVSVRCVKD